MLIVLSVTVEIYFTSTFEAFISLNASTHAALSCKLSQLMCEGVQKNTNVGNVCGMRA